MKFDIKSTSKEDGKEEILHIPSDIKRVIKKLHENTGHSEGKIIRLLDEGMILRSVSGKAHDFSRGMKANKYFIFFCFHVKNNLYLK